MIHRWKMAFWAMLAGTTVTGCITGQSMYLMPIDMNIEEFQNPESAEPDILPDDIPEDLVDEDLEEDADEDDADLDVEDEG